MNVRFPGSFFWVDETSNNGKNYDFIWKIVIFTHALSI